MTKKLQTQKQEVQVGEGAERTRAARVYVPKVDIFSEESGVVILVEMPGVDENSVDINLEKNVLSINGYISDGGLEGFDLTHSEYGIGDYQRSFTIPDEIDRDHIEANINNGVLNILLPKAPEAKAKKITVQAS